MLLPVLSKGEKKYSGWKGMSFKGREVPKVLTSGNHEAIRMWRMRQSLEKTRRLRPDLLETARMTDEQCAILRQIEEE